MEEQSKKDKNKEYCKNYYKLHSEKIRQMNKDNQHERKREEMVQKLNDKTYERLPYRAIKKYNIVFNNETKIYS